MSHELDPWGSLGTPCPLLRVGYCLKCLDCFTCPAMQQKLRFQPAGTWIWVCSVCTGRLVQAARQRSLPIELKGHYTEGRCCHPDCDRWSILLQLVEGPIAQLV